MPNRVPDINNSLYTDTNPENIVSAKRGAWFFRKNKFFYVNHSGDIKGKWIQLPYPTVILPRPNPRKIIMYEYPTMLWQKTTDGYLNEFREVLPKTGWKFYSYDDAFLPLFPRAFNWLPAEPSSSYDTVGADRSRHYDENFYYFKTSSIWYRTPISVFTTPGVDTGEQPLLYSGPPYVVSPRYLPVPSSSYSHDSAISGDQTYDRDYFYIKPSRWKRSSLGIYESVTMTMF